VACQRRYCNVWEGGREGGSKGGREGGKREEGREELYIDR